MDKNQQFSHPHYQQQQTQQPHPPSSPPLAKGGMGGVNSQPQTPNSQFSTPNSQPPTANSQQPTANSQQPTANSQQPTANSQQPTANSQQPQMQTATIERGGDLPENPQVIFSWKAPLRAYKKSGGKVIRFYIVLALLLCIIVYFFGDVILVIPILALLFLFYVLTVTPPPIIENKVTQFGIETAGVTIRWEVLSHFYYTNRFGFHILTLVSHGPYYLHSFIVVPTDEIREVVTQILSQHIMYQQSPKRTLTDRMIDWLSHLVPDEDDEEEKAEEQQKKENAQATSTLPPRPKWSLFTFLQGLRKGKV